MFSFVILAGAALVTVAGLQDIVAGRPGAFFEWTAAHPDGVLLTWASVLFLQGLVLAATRSSRWAVGLVSGGLLAVALASYLKIRELGFPLYPWDFRLLPETLRMLPGFFQGEPGKLAFIAAGAAAWIALLRWLPLPRWEAAGARRAWTGGALGLALLITYLQNNPLHDYLFRDHFTLELARPAESFARNGLVISFVLMQEQGEIVPPPRFSVKRARRLKTHSTVARPPALFETPDIVVVMSESLFDPLRLWGLRWRRDPLAFTRTLAGEGGDLSLAVVPTFGFRTANSEFEFLTGHSVSFMAKGTIPYVNALQDRQLSILDSLKDAGYATVAIHPGVRSFYNRDRVYPLFGFDEFIDVGGFDRARTYGNHVADEEILPLLEDSLDRRDGPSFHFVVTIQNHHPYQVNPFDFGDLAFDPEGMAGDEKVVLNYYTKLLEATDRFHRRLVAQLERRRRPTVLLVFGDHLPPLLPNFGVFRQRLVDGAEPADWSDEERLRMHSTPLVTWSNFPVRGFARPTQASFLGVGLLARLGIPLRPYHEYLAKQEERLPLFSAGAEPLGGIAAPDSRERRWLEDHAIFQYAILTHAVPDAADAPTLQKAAQPAPLCCRQASVIDPLDDNVFAADEDAFTN